MIQVKGVVYSRTLNQEGARHIRELKEATRAGAAEGPGPNRRKEPWSPAAKERAVASRERLSHGCVTMVR